MPYISLHAEIARDATDGVVEGLPVIVVPALGELFLVWLEVRYGAGGRNGQGGRAKRTGAK